MVPSELAAEPLGRLAAERLVEAGAIERLGRDDVAAGLALSDAAGWNQTGDDWRFFLERGEVVGCRDGEGRIVATAAALPYDAATGWVSMVLVDAGWRHRGLATALLRDCVGRLARSGRAAVLDATPAGAPVYRRLGFEAGFAFDRWQGEGEGAASTMAEARRGIDADMVAAIDAEAGGVGRGLLIHDFLGRPGSELLSDAGGGFVLTRAGRRATQIGPLVAGTQAEALALADAALAATNGPVFIDVPQRCVALAADLERRRFTRQRTFTRMALGGDHLLAARRAVFALAGPEFG